MKEISLLNRSELERAGATFVYTWYRPGVPGGRPPEATVLPCDHPGPEWANEPGVVRYETVKDSWRQVTEEAAIADCRGKLSRAFSGRMPTRDQQYLQ